MALWVNRVAEGDTIGSPKLSHFAPSNDQLGAQLATLIGNVGAGSGPTTGLTEAAANALYRRLAVDVPAADVSGLNAVIDPRINPVAQAGNTTLWPKTKLPTDVAYVGTIGSGRSLPATGAQVGDYFLLTRSETGGPPSNRRVAGLYRRGTTAWEAVTLGGLNQAAVDARVVAGTLQPARSGDTTRWGKSKLPTDVAYTGNVGAGSSFPSSPQSGDYFLLTRGEASGPVQTRRASGLYRRGTSDWELVSFGITQTAGDARYVRLPAGAGPNFPSSPQSGDYFLLTRSETSGPVPSRRASGLYLRGATAWELVSFGITQTQGDARYQRLPYGAGPNFPSSPAINDFFLLTRAQTSGPVPQRKAAGLYKRGASDWELESTSGLTQAQVDARIIQQARIGDTSRWAKAKLPTDTAYTGTVGGGTSFPSSPQSGDYFLLTRGETTGPVPNRRAAGLYLRGASAWGLVSLGGLTQTQVDARIIQQARIGDTSRWAKAKLPADTVYGTVNGVGDRLPTTGMIFNDRFLLRRGYTTGRPPNTTNVFPGLYRRGNTAWALALGQGAPVSMWSKGDTLTLNRSELTPLVFDMGYTYGAVLTAGPIGSPGLGSGWRSRGTLTGGSATGSVSIAPTGGLYGIEDGLGAEIWVASTKVPSAVSINGVRRTLSSTSIANIYTSSGSGYPRFESGTAVNVQVEYSDGSFAWPNTQSDGRGSGSGITQTAADARYAPITVAGNALPTTGFNTGDYFLLRRTVSGPGGQGTLNAGLYRRTASAWELQSLGGGSAMGVGTAFPTTGRQTGDVFLLTRPVTGATTQVPRTATITLGRSSQFIGFIYGWSRSSPTFGSISPLPTWSGIDGIYWTGSRYEVGLSSAAATALRSYRGQAVGTLTVGDTTFPITLSSIGTFFQTATGISSTWTASGQTRTVSMTLLSAVATAAGITGTSPFGTTSSTTTTAAGLYRWDGSAWNAVSGGSTSPTSGLTQTQGDARYVRLPATGYGQNTTSALLSYVNSRVLSWAREGSTSRIPKTKLPTDVKYLNNYVTGMTQSGGVLTLTRLGLSSLTVNLPTSGSTTGLTQAQVDNRITLAGRSLPASGFQTGDFFLLTRTVSGPGGQGTQNAGLYKRESTGWVIQTLGGGTGSGLTQTQVDARVRALVANEAEQGNTTRWGKSKLPTDTVFDADLTGFGTRFPTSPSAGQAFLLTRAITAGPPSAQFASGLYIRGASSWSRAYYTRTEADARYYRKSNLYTRTQSDARYWLRQTGFTSTEQDRFVRAQMANMIGPSLPTTGFSTGDLFFLTRTTSGPGGRGTQTAGIWQRTSSAWVRRSSFASIV